MEEQLKSVGNKAMNHAQKLGALEAEIFLYIENHTSVKFVGGIFASRSKAIKGLKGTFARIAEPWIKKKGIPIVSSGTKAGVGVRAVINKAIGFSSVSSLEETKVLEAVEEAVKIAKIRPPDPNWISLPDPKTPNEKGGIFDNKIADLSADRILEMSANCCTAAGDYDKRIMQAMSMITADSLTWGIVNTKGIEVFDKGTAFSAYVGTKAKSKGEEVSSGDFLISRTLTENVTPIAVSASKRTVECFGKRTLPEKHVGPVVFENESWAQLFAVIFTAGISGYNVQENRSVLKDKLSQKVAEEKVSILDDGTLPEGIGTAKMDDEGVPRQKTPIIEKGVLTSFLYDNYSARRESRESTGNSSRRRDPVAAYSNQPMIRPSNMILEPGARSLEALIGEVKNGVLVKGSLIGAGHSNVVTGDFSVTADNAFKIENGAVAYPLKACSVAGNLYQALNSIVAIGNDSRTFGSVINPSVAIEKIVAST
ncbi:MAG TPA: TldD/PmbA family protein [Candidatus Bathyarchaeia archaeon]|nr:TldD/PmbA family protein [Candidatus Bathyarchaeia archaeon]